jgi:outer membrane protein assembly factor BamB
VTPPAAGSGAATFGPNLIVDGTVAYVATNAAASAELSAIDTDGRVLWSVTPGGFGGALAADPGRAIYMTTGVLVTQNGRNTVVPVLASFGEGLGEPLSAVLPAIGPVGVARIAFANGLVYGYQNPLQGTGGVGLFAVHPSTGQLAWSTPSSDLGAVGSVVVGSIQGGQGLSAHDPITGAPAWTTSNNAPAVDPVIAGEFVYYGMGAIVLITDTTGQSAWDPVVFFPEAVVSITPSNGRVFVATSGHLVALTP